LLSFIHSFIHERRQFESWVASPLAKGESVFAETALFGEQEAAEKKSKTACTSSDVGGYILKNNMYVP